MKSAHWYSIFLRPWQRPKKRLFTVQRYLQNVTFHFEKAHIQYIITINYLEYNTYSKFTPSTLITIRTTYNIILTLNLPTIYFFCQH